MLRLILLFASMSAPAARAAEPRSLLSNGDFETGTDGRPDGWGLKAGATWEREGENHFLRLKARAPGDEVAVFRTVEIGPAVRALELKYKVRYRDVRRGKQAWFDGRIILDFKDADRNAVKPSPPPPAHRGTSAGWKEEARSFRVPAGAKALDLMFTLFRVEGGELDFDDVELVPIPVAVVDAIDERARVAESARIAALPRPKAQVPVPTADELPPELRVVGNRLRTAAGKEVRLQGVAVPSMCWSAGGERVLESIGVAVEGWKANCVRLAIRDDFWAGRGPYQKDGGTGYRQLVDDAVNACAGRGAYVVLDLHRFRAPTEAHVAFWAELARRYKDHPAVLFELFNEPHDLTWEVWRNGGKVTEKKGGGGAAAENAARLTTFESVGMQRLLGAVRKEGAKNVAIAGGLDWSYDLSGVLDGFALDDAGGNGVAYSAHVYPWKRDWKGKFLQVAEKYPLFVGEVGADTKKMDFIPADAQEDPYTWSPDAIGMIQKHGLNWTAWCFHPTSTPRAIEDWTFAPTKFWGAYVKRALAGETFEMKGER